MVLTKAEPNKIERLYELYVVSCNEVGVTASVRDFVIWLDEEGYE